MKINKQLICGLCLLISILNAQALSVVCRKNICINILTADELAIQKANSETGLTLDHIKTWLWDFFYPPIIEEPTPLLNLEELLDTDSLKVRIGFNEIDLLSTDSGSGDRAVLIAKNPCVIRIFIESKQLIFDITVSIKKNEPVISNIQEIPREEYLACNTPPQDPATPPGPGNNPPPPAPGAESSLPNFPITGDLAQEVVKRGYVIAPKDIAWPNGSGFQFENKRITVALSVGAYGRISIPNSDDAKSIMSRIQGYYNYAALGFAKGGNTGGFYRIAIKIQSGNKVEELHYDITHKTTSTTIDLGGGKSLKLHIQPLSVPFKVEGLGDKDQNITIYVVTIKRF